MASYEPRLTVFLSSSMALTEFSVEREFVIWLFNRDLRLDYAQLYAIEMWAGPVAPSEEYPPHVQQSQAMILLLGTELRKAVRKEVELAKEKGIPILVFKCTRYTPNSELKAFMDNELKQNVNWCDYSTAQELAEKLCQSLRKLVVEGFTQWLPLGMRVAEQADAAPKNKASVSLKLDAALFRFSKGNLKEARALFEQVIAGDNDIFDAHFHLGVILDNIQPYEHEEAVKHFREAIRIRPEDVGAHFNLAVALHHTKRPLEAIEHYDKVEWSFDPRRSSEEAVAFGKHRLFRAEARADTGDPAQKEAALKDLETGALVLKATSNAIARYWFDQVDGRREYINAKLKSP
jgi:tetratricopeptide (TPR) repeat protein